MKHILLGTAALACVAMGGAHAVSAQEPALQLDVGGKIMTYGIYSDYDDVDGLREFDFRKDSEISLNGSVALDNGITVGASILLNADRADAITKESYVHMSSHLGRVNIGEEDGAAFLMQVAAPAVDANIDGLRPVIGELGQLNYAHDDFGRANKFTYFTPVFNGLQLGASYTPTIGVDLDGTAFAESDNDVGQLENGLEIAARYETKFEDIRLTVGAGYSHADTEVNTAATDDLQAWNAGINAGIGAFSVGASYMTTNLGLAGDNDVRAYVVGANYKTGAYTHGVTYFNGKSEGAAAGVEAEAKRWTAGTVYEWGPGLSFRGSVQYADLESTDITGTSSTDAYAVNLGMQVLF